MGKMASSLKAAALARRILGMQELIRACGATAADLRALDEIIAGGKKAKNATARLRAIELKWAYGYGRPAQVIQHEGNLSPIAVQIVTGLLKWPEDALQKYAKTGEIPVDGPPFAAGNGSGEGIADSPDILPAADEVSPLKGN